MSENTIKALRESEERFRLINSRIPGIVYQFKVDVNGNRSFPYVSSKVESYLNISVEDVMRDAEIWLSLTHPDDYPSLAVSIVDSMQKMILWEWEGRFIRDDKKVVWLHGSSVPSKYEDGSVVWDGVFVDITDRKNAEIELFYSKEELDRIFNLSPDFVGYGNLDGVFTKVNKALYSILGYKEEEFLKQPFMDFIHPDDVAATGAELQNAQEGVSNIAIDNRYRCKDGSYKWIAWSVVSDLSKNEFLAVGRDISDRKQAEISLIEREKKLEKQIELRTCELEEKVRELGFQKLAMDEHSIVSIADVSGTIIYVNQKFCNVSGFSEQELIGRNHRILNSGEHSKDFFSNLWNTIVDGKVWQGIIKNMKKDGGYYWSEVTITPFLDNKGKPFQYVAIRTDITERINAVRAAEKANLAKSDFLFSMSHELRTPLSAILGFSQRIEMKTKEEKTRDSSQKVINAGNHILSLINEILDLSKIESGNIELSIEKHSLNEILDNMLTLVSPLAEKNFIQIDNKINTPSYINVDELRFKQVLLNILSNAIKYNSEMVR